MSIKIKVTAEQFIELMAKNEHVRDFTNTAKLAILQTIEDLQHNDDEHADPLGWFQAANEVEDEGDVPEDVRDRATQLGNDNWLWFD